MWAYGWLGVWEYLRSKHAGSQVLRLAVSASLLLPVLAGRASGKPPPDPSAAAVRAMLVYDWTEPPTRSTVPPHARTTETLRDRLPFNARSDDPWLAFDKVQHLAFSFLWTLSSQYVLVSKADWSRRRAVPWSVGVSASMGISKELYDWRAGPRRDFSHRDLVADALGIALATGLIFL